MLRSVGSIIFGLAADRYGRKWPFVANNVLFIVLELVGLLQPAVIVYCANLCRVRASLKPTLNSSPVEPCLVSQWVAFTPTQLLQHLRIVPRPLEVSSLVCCNKDMLLAIYSQLFLLVVLLILRLMDGAHSSGSVPARQFSLSSSDLCSPKLPPSTSASPYVRQRGTLEQPLLQKEK
jgi:MFS family permease